MATNYTGNSAPTLSNAPASSWTDDAAKHSHVGNTYLVTGSGSDAGKVYSFEEYPSPLVKSASGLPKPIVTITDGGDNLNMVHAELTLSPIQSLNGYDHPWAGGAGKNKLTLDIVNMKALNTNGSWSGNAFTQNGITYTVNDDGTVNVNGTASEISQLVYYDENTNCPFNGYLLNGCPSGGGNTTFDLRVSDVTTSSSSDYGSGTTINLAGTGRWRCIIFVRSGATLNNILYKPMIRASGTDATFEPWENLCPITGHTQATLNRTGKNIASPTTFERGSLNSATGALIYSTTRLASPFLPVESAKKYYFATDSDKYVFEVYQYRADKTFISGTVATINSDGGFITTNASAKFVRYTVRYPSNATIVVADQTKAICTQSDTAVDLPTQLTQYTLSLGQTVYGGKIDLVTGEGEITWISKTMTGNEPSVQQTGRVAVKACQDAPAKSSGSKFAYCSAFNAAASADWAYITTSMTAADFMQYLRDNPTDICYELQTPISLSLTGQQIQTLLGENNVWGDGEVSRLVYRSNQFTPAWQWFETWTMPKITRDNGQVIVLPYPQEYTPEIYDVDAATTGRNAAGTMIRDRVARKHKFNYKFPPLSQADATEILDAVQDVSFTLTTASPETGAKANYRVYVGDRSLPVYWMPNHNNASWLYSSLSLNLIEM